jgi:IclR family transcriptional regulator, mhp operon transcriptional activator
VEKYKPVRAIKRGLDVLVALNQERSATVATLSERTGIHRTTVYRVLETLEQLGFVRRGLREDSYRLTRQVCSLSEGFDDSERIASVASPYLDELLGEVNWPSSVATPESDAMIIRETTHGRSEWFVHDVSVGTRSPVLTTAMGRAYLAFCDADEREQILAEIARLGSAEAALARNPRYVQHVLESTRVSGYGFSFGDAEAALGSVALPIQAEERVVGCINVVFFTSSVPKQSAVRNFVPALRRAVAAIERNLAEH